jgi:putative FmdB family regulatory protein
MPIYLYHCTHCHLQQEVLQKIHDSPLTTCPSCQQATFVKQVTAAGFQLKGSGWYETDFKNKTKSNSDKPAQSNDVTPKAQTVDPVKTN